MIILYCQKILLFFWTQYSARVKKIRTFLIFITVVIIWSTISWGLLRLQNPLPLPLTYIFIEKNGSTFTKIPNEYGWFEPYTGSLQTDFTDALIQIEDGRYYKHLGIDILGKIWALKANLESGNIVRWGSTITEQYIKNRYYSSAKRTYLQKIREAILSLIISTKKDKDILLRDYLDSIYFGNNIYGIKTAIVTYFGKSDLSELTTSEISFLLALIKYPGIQDTNDIDWRKYRNTIESRLWWTWWSVDFSFEKPVIVNQYPVLSQRIRSEFQKYCEDLPSSLWFFVLDITQVSCDHGVLILSIDGALQKFADDTVKGTLAPLAENNVTNSAVLILEPKTKKYLAYIGNRSSLWNGSDIDIITRRRSVWSTLKPFLYLLALEQWAEIDTLILDDETIYSTEYKDKVFVPRNYNLKTFGPVRLAESLWSSLNLASVRLTEALGLENVYRDFLSKWIDLEHESSYYGYGIILWGAELTLENLIQSYAKLIPKNQDINAFLLYHILSSNEYRTKSFGVSSILNTSIPMAVKTGTSTDFRDNWTISYHDDAVIGVWVGNLDNSPMVEVSGISGAGPVWKSLVEYMVKNRMIKNTVQEIPKWIQSNYLCLDTGCLRKTKTYKKSDKEPKSRILDKLYYSSDFFSPPTLEERERWNILNQ